MNQYNAVVRIDDYLITVESTIKELQRSGLDMNKISLAMNHLENTNAALQTVLQKRRS